MIAERTGLGRQAACEGEEESGLARNEMPRTECDEAEKERQADSVDEEKVVAWWCRLGFEMGNLLDGSSTESALFSQDMRGRRGLGEMESIKNSRGKRKEVHQAVCVRPFRGHQIYVMKTPTLLLLS